MSVCLETSNVLASSVGTSSSVSSQVLAGDPSVNTQSVVSAISTSQSSISTNVINSPLSANIVQVNNDKSDPQQVSTPKGIAKLVVTNHPTSGQCLQKVVNPPVITVLNPSGPLTVVKTLCVTSGVSSAPQFTLNSAPLTVTNAVGKSPTITLLNAPVTVVKAITGQSLLDKNVSEVVTNVPAATTSVPAIIESRGHNVFVKNTCPESTVSELPQSHKLLTATNFSQTNVLTNVNTQLKTVNGQRNKLKILSNVLPGTSQVPSNNVILNKSSPTQRYIQRPKVIGPNGATTKYLNKTTPTALPNNNVVKQTSQQNVNPNVKVMQDKTPTTNRMVYPTHKGQIKNIPANSYMMPTKSVKTIVPQHKNIPGQVQRTGAGVRTIPPQRPQKLGGGVGGPPSSANKPNYIGKHAVQAQKMRHHPLAAHNKLKSSPVGMASATATKVSPPSTYNIHGGIQPTAVPPQPQPTPDKHLTELTFNQALTAQIIETLSNNSTPMPSSRYEILPTRYDHAFSCPPDSKQSINETPQQPFNEEEKEKTPLDTLSMICHAVLLDHNYNATLPPDSPTRPSPPVTSQVNGISTSNSGFSPGSGKRRSLPPLNTVSAGVATNLSNLPAVAVNNNNTLLTTHDDDAASDISDVSERKHDTEGEETDTAPEAEAVANETFDGYGDYVTRCICGFLHDDGYMVECDRCKVWQHVQCVLKNRQVPDEFLCEVCDSTKPVDRQKARTIQQQWLRDRQFADPKLRKDIKLKEAFKPKETISDTDSSDGEQPAHNNIPCKGRSVASRRKSDNHQKTLPRQRREANKEVVQRRQKRREKRIVRKKAKVPVKSHSDDENQDTWASHLPQLRQWIEKYEEAVTNHYSPELRARISNIRVNGTHSDLSMQFDASVHKCRVHTQPLTEFKYLVSTVHLAPNTPIIELRGKYMLSTQHRNPGGGAGGGSLTTRQHSQQRPGPFLFFYRLQKDNTEVCVDTRTYGNIARFIRRSCKPNSELRHCIEKGHLHLYLVSITSVDRNTELTIKHESHDLAAIGTTQIACACGNLEECTVNKTTTTTIKKNGDVTEIQTRKRRGRRTISSHIPEPEPPAKVLKEEPAPPSPARAETPPALPSPVVKSEPEPILKKEIKNEVEVEEVTVKIRVEEEQEIKDESDDLKKEQNEEIVVENKNDVKLKDEAKSPPTTPIATRRSSHYKSDKEDDSNETKEQKEQNKKKSREERKLEAILRAIEQMEKKDAKKQEHKEKQAHRRESEPGPTPKEDDKSEPKVKRRRRKGRARTISQSTRRNRVNSTDSYITSGDEIMLSPNDSNQQQPILKPSMKDISSDHNDNNRAAVGLLLALSNGDNNTTTNTSTTATRQQQQNERSPTRDIDSNSNSTHSSPETQLSSACLLVQAAVEPLEPGFKFPKTKKGLMNEWLNKVPEPVVQSASSISPSSLTPHIINNNSSDDVNSIYNNTTPTKNLAALAQAATFCDLNTQTRGSAKKRWLRQAISEDQSCDSPGSRAGSPPISDMVAPPKKRRLPRESLSTDVSPPTTPTSLVPPKLEKEPQEGSVEIVFSCPDEDSPTQSIESDVILKERAAKMKQEYNMVPSIRQHISERNEMTPLGCLMDPRLMSRENRMFHNTDLVGTVEKALSILGVEHTNKPEVSLPKRKVKLSITEYRQRKKLNNNDKNDEPENEPEQPSTEENNSSESFKATSRPRAGSTSSSTSLTSSDDEITIPDIPTKAPAFNSEPTELERQREISRLRLKKAFGLSITEDPRPTLNVEAILNLELEPKVIKPIIPIPSPTFPIPGSAEIRDVTQQPLRTSPLSPTSAYSAAHQQPAPPDPPTTPPPPPPPPEANNKSLPPTTKMETDEISAAEEDSIDATEGGEVDGGAEDAAGTHSFYTPDEEDEQEEEEKEAATVKVEMKQQDVTFEETESSISYVPPFNNPIYPNDSFTAFTSAIDDDARYEGRNPSPPPNLEQEDFVTQS